MSILKKPLITEKYEALSEMSTPQYGFVVALKANKAEIKQEIERVYDVNIASINTMVVRGKSRTRYSKRGVVHGKKPNFKKAIVTLKKGQEIDFYKHI